MTEQMKDEFLKRILSIEENDKPKFGKMNVYQMVCHCADQFRMMFGELDGLRMQNIDVIKLREMVQRKETVPTVEGLDQVAGGGTKPTSLENDKKILTDYLSRFNRCDKNYKFSFHPYFGEIDIVQWEKLAVHHLDHHLEQFGR